MVNDAMGISRLENVVSRLGLGNSVLARQNVKINHLFEQVKFVLCYIIVCFIIDL